MKRASFIAFALFIITTCGAQSFNYLTFEQTDGTTLSLPVTGLTLTFSDGNLVSSDGTSIPLASLSKMFFTDTSGIALSPSLQAEGAVSAYTASGSYVGHFSDIREAICHLSKGVYIFKDSTGTIVKKLVR